jgi:UDP-N-acetylmuramoyl-tripeptide--D-alanyl-D-alanine ligase
MIEMTLAEAAFAVGGTVHGDAGKSIDRVFTDSREAEGGNGLFAAIKGERADGHDYVTQVIAKGGSALVSEDRGWSGDYITVDDTAEAVRRLAAYYRETKCRSTKVIGVTGSVGKTTTKDMTGLIFSEAGKCYVTHGNRNSMLGLPLSVLSVDAGDEYAVLELGMNTRGEIAVLSRIAKPYMSVITVIGSSHLEALGSMENIRDEKFDILAGESEDGRIILNADDPLSYEKGKTLGSRAVFCGIANENSRYRAENITETGSGISFTVDGTAVILGVPGIHNVYDALFAYAAGVECGIGRKICAEALSRFTPQGNRQHIYQKNGVTVIADCYNASPESMKAAFGILASAKGRKIAVIGDMLELGENTDKLHAQVGREAAASADILILVGDKAEIYASASSGHSDTHIFGTDEKHKAAELIRKLMLPGDTLLFKASNRLHLEDIIKDVGL